MNHQRNYIPVIGLEVHAQLLTATKIFCSCPVQYGTRPNSLVCPVCLGHPGTLPVINGRAVEMAMMFILAVGGEVQRRSFFARKNYFYPDLPKGYQISQYRQPLGIGGEVMVELEGSRDHVAVTRIHLEEDAAKLLHPEDGTDRSLVDFNRCGVPLIEIVSGPDLNSPRQARAYLKKVKQILQYLGICSGDMEKGALRCDANISLRRGDGRSGVRTELKNLNSFRAVEKALRFEIMRQEEILQSGKTVEQQTLLWDQVSEKTAVMRGNEESEDYRYFSEPDLLPLEIEAGWVDEIRSSLPQLPDDRFSSFVDRYHLSDYDALQLTDSRELADYFESVALGVKDRKLAANWVMVELLRAVKEKKGDLRSFIVGPEMLAELLQIIESGIISGKIAKNVFDEMVATGRRAADIIEEKGLHQITDGDWIGGVIDEVLEENRNQVEKYRSGKKKLFEFFVGQVMSRTGGKANPQMVREILRERLNG